MIVYNQTKLYNSLKWTENLQKAGQNAEKRETVIIFLNITQSCF